VASHDDVIKALVDEALASNPHPDRQSVLQEWRDKHSDDKPAEDDGPTEAGAGAGGDESKPETTARTSSRKERA
jgi:hypothetical protein